MPETRILLLSDPEGVARARQDLGHWVWLDGDDARPWVLRELVPAGKVNGRPQWRLTLLAAEVDPDSRAWVIDGQELRFGPDEAVLEDWMDKSYTEERVEEMTRDLDYWKEENDDDG